MEVRELRSWDDFESELRELGLLRQEITKTKSYVSSTLFRGQSDARWPLSTTLERMVGDKETLSKYYLLVTSVQSRVETFTGQRWEIPDVAAYLGRLENSGLKNYIEELPTYEYMVYLRHHGFPSPLLDWSRSPYVAAYFAFRELQSRAETVAIFGYISQLGVKAFRPDGLNIRNLGSYIRADKRHFLQQCEYTVCTGIEDGTRYYGNHEDVFAQETSRSQSQDVLWKFVLPATLRKAALQRLDMYNINAYSLFGSEDSLMEAVFFQEHFGE